MGFELEASVPAITVFLQGLLSFFSPCVLPLVPLYLGYLSGGIQGESDFSKHRGKLLLNTVCFVLGISAAFFLMGAGVSAAGSFLHKYQMVFAKAGGILIVLFGFYQLGVFGKSKVLGNEHRLPIHLEKLTMSPFTALLFGFTFSFAWTPCVGPALASVLVMAGSAQTQAAGFLLIGVYTAGFVLPFLAVGLFTAKVLAFFKKHGNVVRYTVKAGGVLMILMGLMMFTGKMNAVTGYLSGAKTPQAVSEKKEETAEKEDRQAEQKADGQEKKAEHDFTLKDQYGEEHTLSDYKGKVVFLNFWATWCPPCRAEMPDIQKLYEEYTGEDTEVVILGIAAPEYGNETDEAGIIQFMKENGYTYPVVMDVDGEVFSRYGITAYPTTFMIDKKGEIFGYAQGQLSEDVMRSIIQQTLEGKKDE
ncbi:cytochrome C biogenesis protein [Ruminococcus sp. AF18-22]|nr:cytochrome C biogenesis protein [Ruminococcus sp. AF18-22]